MASLVAPAPEGGRISQILPSVKCSSCNQPVPIAELGDHVCATPPPMPAASPKPPASPTATSFFQQKYQNIIAGNRGAPSPAPTQPIPPTPLVQPPPRASSTGPLQRGKSPGPPSAPPARSSQQVAPLNVQRRPSRAASPLARTGSPNDASKVAFPAKPGSPEFSRAGPSAPRVPSPLATRTSAAFSIASSRTSSGPARLNSPDIPAPVRSPPLRNQPTPVRQPAQSSPAPFASLTSPPPEAPIPAQSPPLRNQPTPVGSRGRPDMYARQPAQSSPAPFVPPPMMSPPGAMDSSQRARAASNASMGSVIYSTGRPNMPPPSRGPPLSVNVNAGPAGVNHYAQHPGTPMSGITSPVERPAELDTKTGGEAGMAGVGRRGFAAAARAAMFANNMGGFSSPHSEHPLFQPPQVPGMDGRRAHAPRYLDITSANQYNPLGTPPLSPGSTVSPRSPQHSPLSATTPPPPQEARSSITPTQPSIVSRTPSPLDRRYSNRDRVIPPAPEPPKQPLPATPTTPSLPFFEKFKNKITPVDTNPPAPDSAEPSPLSPPADDDDDESEFEGLAYADGSDDEGTEVPPNKVRFPSMSGKTNSFAAKSESKYSSASSTATPSPRLPMTRSLSQSTATSSYTVRTTAKSTGALDRAMETLFEEEATSPTASSVSSPAMFPAALAQDGSRDRESMRPKMPVRAHTSPGGRTSKLEAKRRPPKARTCLKCNHTIDDGRWIQMEGGGVMCDKCWKHMYLPKCRRCNESIEKHAVSSSDGQLKGKYHRDCFNCHTCHKPFPDKTFYVFDGKPFCAYHYHEANKSLCAAPSCGQPIEGPCAVSHSGERYHPEHFTCEHPRCSERLVEYWEADGKLYCDRHARGLNLDLDEDDDDLPLATRRPRGDNVRDSVTHATKRKTVFLNLGPGGMI